MGQTETTSIGAVPASGASSSDPIADIVKNLGVDQRTMAAAISPVSGAHAGQVPTSLSRPVGSAPQSQGYAQPRNKGQAIANMITSAGNAVSQVMTAETEKKQANLTDATTKLMQASSLKDEATQQRESALAMLGNATPGSPEAASYKSMVDKADATIKQNDDAMQKITVDPKMRKDLAKILHINHVDLSANDPVHLKILDNASKNVKTWQDKREAAKQAKEESNRYEAARFSQEYQKAQPMTAGAPNVLAQQKMQIEAAQQKALFEYRGKVDPAYIRLQASNFAEQTRIKAQQDNQERQFAHEEKLKDITLNNEYKTITRRAVVARQLASGKRADALADPLLNFRFDHKEISRLQTENMALIGTDSNLQLQRKALYNKPDGKTPLTNKEIAAIKPEIDLIDYQINQLHTMQKNNSDMVQSYIEEANTLQKLHGNKLTEGNDGTSTGTSTEPEPSSAEPTGSPDDPDSFLDRQ
jgi:hypothetical protein